MKIDDKLKKIERELRADTGPGFLALHACSGEGGFHEWHEAEWVKILKGLLTFSLLMDPRGRERKLLLSVSGD